MEVLIEGNRQGLLDVFLTDLVTKSMAPLGAKSDVPKFSLYMGVLPYFIYRPVELFRSVLPPSPTPPTPIWLRRKPCRTEAYGYGNFN
jgi:hypothetical protein